MTATPLTSFAELALPPQLTKSLERMGYKEPTPIQAAALPLALSGRDIMGTAQTGTGKTAAFGIPLVKQILTQSRGTALVLLPTRELAQQVLESLVQLIGDIRLPTALIIGGESMPKQIQMLRARPRLIVGTPGRINDLLVRGDLMLHDANFLVLDETDRMLDMGFGIQLEAIVKYLPAKRQTLMFSATLPDNILKLAGKYLTNPERIAVGSTTATAEKVTQNHIEVADDKKFDLLMEELTKRTGSVIVFVKSKWGSDKLADKLRKRQFAADALHGDLRQNQRERVIDGFREQKFRILVATDIAARGLDIPHVEHVINYDLPHSPEDYIHRIGRTARAGAEGAALNFLSPADAEKWHAIQRMFDPSLPKFAGKKAPTSNGGRSAGNGGGSRSGNRRRRGGGSGKPKPAHASVA